MDLREQVVNFIRADGQRQHSHWLVVQLLADLRSSTLLHTATRKRIVTLEEYCSHMEQNGHGSVDYELPILAGLLRWNFVMQSTCEAQPLRHVPPVHQPDRPT